MGHGGKLMTPPNCSTFNLMLLRNASNFSFHAAFFPLMNALVYIDIDYGIHY